MNANLYVYGNSLIYGNLNVYSNLNVSRDVSMVANVYIGGNSLTYGNLIISRDVSMGANIYVGGNAYISGNLFAGTFNVSSDYRIKSNIDRVNYTIDNLYPKTYFNNISKKIDIGFIAHEVQEEFPFLVNGKKDEVDSYGNPIYQSVNYIGLISLLTNELKLTKKRLEDLEYKYLEIIKIISPTNY